MSNFYAVEKGTHPGIYFKWEEVGKAIEGYPERPLFKRFGTYEEAEFALAVGINKYTFMRRASINEYYGISAPIKSIFTDKTEFEAKVAELKEQGIKAKTCYYKSGDPIKSLSIKEYGIKNGSDKPEAPKGYKVVYGTDFIPKKFVQYKDEKYPRPNTRTRSRGDIKDISHKTEELRDKVLSTLKLSTQRDYDKFTADNDSTVGEYTEQTVRNWIDQEYGPIGLTVFRYIDGFDLKRIEKIVDKALDSSDPENPKLKESLTDEEKKYLADYYYDKYDIQLVRNGRQALIDIKGAVTTKTPSGSWDFLYPNSQTKAAGKADYGSKEYVCVVYCIADKAKGSVDDIKDVQVAGVIGLDKIAAATFIPKGEYTKLGVKSQIDNRQIQLGALSDPKKFVEDFILQSEPEKNRRDIIGAVAAGVPFREAVLKYGGDVEIAKDLSIPVKEFYNHKRTEAIRAGLSMPDISRQIIGDLLQESNRSKQNSLDQMIAGSEAAKVSSERRVKATEDRTER